MNTWILAAHIAVLGYWLGSELVINSTYRLVCYAEDMPFEQRDKLMAHVMNVDQHVRYALVLQVSLGSMLAASYGYIPGGQAMVVIAGVFGLAWLIFVEIVHRLSKNSVGQTLARIDRVSRYFLMLILLAIAIGLLGEAWPAPSWLRWKLAAFAGVMLCGVGIRLALVSHFRAWADITGGNLSPSNNLIIKKTYVRATAVLVLLWVFIGIIVFLSINKPV